MRTIEGIDQKAVTEWLSERVVVQPPLEFQLIIGGHSNLTFRVTDTERRQWVLRRPPLNSVLHTAHDMEREARIVQALAGSGVPVPPVVGLCTDEAVKGSPFYVMNFVDGVVARTAAGARAFEEDTRRIVSRNLIEVLVRLHALAPEEVGLGDLGKKTDYVLRQLRRWSRQVDSLSKRELPLLRQVYQELTGRVPPEGGVGIVHGDYRLDNCIVGVDGSIAAVLDWELCTLGDTRADLGMLLVYWAEPGDILEPLGSPPTTAGGFASRRELVDDYCVSSGHEAVHLDYFVAFAYWRLACILEGVHARYLSGAMGKGAPPGVERFAPAVERLTERASDILSGRPAF